MANDDKDTIRILGILAASPPLILLRAVVVTDLWLWFIVPLGAIEVGTAHMWGILIATQLMTYSRSPPNDKPGAWEYVFMSTFVSLAMWGYGAIAHGFM